MCCSYFFAVFRLSEEQIKQASKLLLTNCALGSRKSSLFEQLEDATVFKGMF